MLYFLRLWLDRILQGVCVALMVGLAALVLAAVFMRAAGASPLWYDEVAAIWLVWLTFFGAALVTLRRAHLGFDGLVRALPLAARRACFALAEFAALAFYLATAVYGWRVLDIIGGETLVSLPWLQYKVVQGVIPVAAALMFAGQLLGCREAWERLR